MSIKIILKLLEELAALGREVSVIEGKPTVCSGGTKMHLTELAALTNLYEFVEQIVREVEQGKPIEVHPTAC